MMFRNYEVGKLLSLDNVERHSNRNGVLSQARAVAKRVIGKAILKTE